MQEENRYLTGDPVLDDFRNFLYLAWRFLELPEPTPIQYDIAYYLQHGPKRAIVEAFRGVGKSWITSAFVVWTLLRDPNENIMVVSASKTRADDFSTFTQRLIQEMPELSILRPKQGQRDSKVAFDVGPAQASHAPSVKSVGITGQMTGGRAGLIVADDVEVPTNSMTQMMRDKLSESVKEFDAVLKPDDSSNLMMPVKRIVYLGTPQTEMSIYNELQNRGYEARIWPAKYPGAERLLRYAHTLAPIIRDKVELDPSIEGKTTEPVRFSDFDLIERESSYGRSGFALQFMLDTRLSDLERYPLKLNDLAVMDLDTELGPEKVVWASSPELVINDVPNVGLSNDKYHRPMAIQGSYIPYTGSVLAIDPAGRGKDETGYAVVKILNSQLFLMEAGGLLGGYDDATLQQLADIAKRQKVNRTIVESNFGDGMFLKLLTPFMTRTHPNTIEEVRHTTNKEARIIDTLEPVLNQHRLIVNKSIIKRDYESVQEYPGEHKDKYMLFYQLTHLTREKGALLHDDRLEAVSMAVQYWVEQMARDIDEAMADEKDRALRLELESFHSNVGASMETMNEWTAL